jgi:hypothetical protein
MVPVFVARPAGNCSKPSFASRPEPTPFASMPYCKSGSSDRRPTKMDVPMGLGLYCPGGLTLALNVVDHVTYCLEL